jgi:hypothetical protein
LNSAADFFKASRRTVHRRHNGGLTQATSHEMAQILSSTEERTLVRWIKNYTIAGAPITYSLMKELTLIVRAARVTHASRSTPALQSLTHINDKWIARFQKRNLEIGGIFARHLEHSRKDGASYTRVERWFDAVASKMEQHTYLPSDI